MFEKNHYGPLYVIASVAQADLFWTGCRWTTDVDDAIIAYQDELTLEALPSDGIWVSHPENEGDRLYPAPPAHVDGANAYLDRVITHLLKVEGIDPDLLMPRRTPPQPHFDMLLDAANTRVVHGEGFVMFDPIEGDK